MSLKLVYNLFNLFSNRNGRVAHEFIVDTLSSSAALSRTYIDNKKALAGLAKGAAFGRGFWGLLSLELWQQAFHDRASEFTSLPRSLKERAAR